MGKPILTTQTHKSTVKSNYLWRLCARSEALGNSPVLSYSPNLHSSLASQFLVWIPSQRVPSVLWGISLKDLGGKSRLLPLSGGACQKIWPHTCDVQTGGPLLPGPCQMSSGGLSFSYRKFHSPFCCCQNTPLWARFQILENIWIFSGHSVIFASADVLEHYLYWNTIDFLSEASRKYIDTHSVTIWKSECWKSKHFLKKNSFLRIECKDSLLWLTVRLFCIFMWYIMNLSILFPIVRLFKVFVGIIHDA